MAKLAAMRYKNYVWPHNPRVYTIDYRREVAVQKIPMGRYRLQDLGLGHRVMRGEGEFVGEGAYEEFKKLASVFYSGGPGALVHPIWQTSSAYFVELSLAQAPRPDYVKYTFTFWEGMAESTALKEVSGLESGAEEQPTAQSEAAAPPQARQTVSAGVWHTVRKGETLWAIARKYGVTLAEVMERNPQLKNPNLILTGEKVRVK